MKKKVLKNTDRKPLKIADVSKGMLKFREFGDLAKPNDDPSLSLKGPNKLYIAFIIYFLAVMFILCS